jgi:hypothetical protein
MPDRIHLRTILSVFGVLALTLMLVGVVVYWLWSDQLPSPWRDAPNSRPDFKVHGPLLDSAPQPGRAAYDAEKQKLLDSWQWLDRGVARIPIDQAMSLMTRQAEEQNKAAPRAATNRRPQ